MQRHCKGRLGTRSLARSALAVGLLVPLSGLALAAGNDMPAGTGRYSMAPVDGGVLRMDTETGAVSLCAKKNAAWSCDTVADDYKAMQQENEALKKELSELQRERRDGGTQAKADRKLELPSEEEIDKAISQVEKYLRKFKGLIEKYQGPDTPGHT